MLVNSTTGSIHFNSTEYNQTLAIEDKLASSPYVHSISGPGYPYEKMVNYTDLVSSPEYSNQYINQTAAITISMSLTGVRAEASWIRRLV